MLTIRRDRLRGFLDNRPKGDVVTVLFTKRTTGKTRVLAGRINHPGKSRAPWARPPYSFSWHDLYPVFDTHLQEWRSVPLDGIHAIEADGNTYVVADEME